MTMNHHQRKVLHAIFAHPLNANLEMKDIVNVLNALGAEIDAKSKSRLGVTLNGRTTVLHLSSHSLLKAEVIQIRKFPESAGLRPRPIRSSNGSDPSGLKETSCALRQSASSFGPDEDHAADLT